MLDDNKDLFLEQCGEMEQKLLIMYLIDRMEIPLSYNHISEFVLDTGYMEYLELMKCLFDMEEMGYLDKTTEGNSSRYEVTSTGIEALEMFAKRIPQVVKGKINQYILDNKRVIKKDYEVLANYFEEHNSDGSLDFIVKCGTYENDTMLMELNVSVVSKEQAKLICKNWKKNASAYYASIIKDITAQ